MNCSPPFKLDHITHVSSLQLSLLKVRTWPVSGCKTLFEKTKCFLNLHASDTHIPKTVHGETSQTTLKLTWTSKPCLLGCHLRSSFLFCTAWHLHYGWGQIQLRLPVSQLWTRSHSEVGARSSLNRQVSKNLTPLTWFLPILGHFDSQHAYQSSSRVNHCYMVLMHERGQKMGCLVLISIQ